MLLRAGADPNKPMYDGAGPLFLAAKKGDLAQVRRRRARARCAQATR